VWGPGSLNFVKDVEGMYERIARSISAYEKSAEVNPFSSKYDYYLKGEAELTEIEMLGLELFEDPGKGNCAACHPSAPGPNGEPPLFTDFSYDNLGVPKNSDNPFYTMPRKWNPDGEDWVDPGLGGFLKAAGEDGYLENWGKHKVPTLRNVDKRPYPEFVKAFGHNGFFKSLEEIVHFYNTRDVEEWPAPEVAENVNTDELGDLGLSSEEEVAIVAFMKTLSDGYESLGKPVVQAPATAEHSTFLKIAGPNPFNPRTTLRYSISEKGAVKILVYNIMGQNVTTLVDGSLEAGSQTIVWDAGNLPSGTYFVRMETKNQMLTRKLLLVK